MLMHRSFSEWLLLERALDQQMRSAAARAHAKFHANTMIMVKEACDKFVRGLAAHDHKYDQRGDEHTLASNFIHAIRMANGIGGNVMLTDKHGSDTMVAYCIMRESELVLPPNITIENYKAAFSDLSGSAPRFMFEFQSKGKSGTAGEYHTGRTVRYGAASFVGQPKLVVYKVKSLDFKEGGGLHTMIMGLKAAKSEGKSAHALVRHTNKWVSQFEKELLSFRNTIVHEYIHFLDDLRYKANTSQPGNIKRGIDSSANKDDKEKKAYWLSDAEWNAHFQASAESVEDSISSFLIAATTDTAASFARSEVGKSFDTMTPAARCRVVGDFVVDDLMRVINRALNEDWVAPTIKEFGLERINLKGLHLYALLMVAKASRGTGKFMFKEPELRMKFVNRIMSLVQDLQGIITAHKTRMSQGKAYTASEFRVARAKFPGKGTQGEDAYNMLYTGMMMGETKPYDPKKPHTNA